MNVPFNNSTAAPIMQPVPANAIPIDDHETDVAVPAAATEPKISIPLGSKASTVGNLSRTSTPSTIRSNILLRNHCLITLVVLYLVHAFLLSKLWQFAAKVRAPGKELAQLFEFQRELAQLDFANSIVKFNHALEQRQKQCQQSASSELHQHNIVDIQAKLLEFEEFLTLEEFLAQKYNEKTNKILYQDVFGYQHDTRAGYHGDYFLGGLVHLINAITDKSNEHLFRFVSLLDGYYFKPTALFCLPGFRALLHLLQDKLAYMGMLLQSVFLAINSLFDEYLCGFVSLPDGNFFGPADLAFLPNLRFLPSLDPILYLHLALCIWMHSRSFFFTGGLLLTGCLCLFCFN